MDVLVVEDNPLVRETVACGLEEVGLAVATMPAAEPAIEMARASGPPKVLVTDIDLGAGLDGVALAAIFAGRWPEVAVVFMTGREERHLNEHRLGPRQCLVPKPFSLAVLAGIALEFAKPRPRGTDTLVALPFDEDNIPGSPGRQRPQNREIVTGHPLALRSPVEALAGRVGQAVSHASCDR